MEIELPPDLVASVNLLFDPVNHRYRTKIPECANIAGDTVGRHASGPNHDHVALIFERTDGAVERYSFAELDLLATRFAIGLQALGVSGGVPVAVHMGQRPETAIAHLAVYKLGGIVVTVSQLYGLETIEYILNDCKAPVIVTERGVWDRVGLANNQVPHLKHTVLVGAPRDPRSFEHNLAPNCEGFEPARTKGDDPALLMYTSGSTGRPKGLLHGHRVLHAYIPTLQMIYECELFTHPCIFWSPADWAWVGGLLDLVLPAWFAGHAVIASEARFDSIAAFDLMARHRVTHSFMTPTALKRLAELKDPGKRWDLALRVICTGGESLPSEIIRWAEGELKVVCNEFYGLTEINHLIGNCRRLYPIKPGSMGRAFPGHDTRLVDENGDPVAVGVVGEIVGSTDDPTLFLGYWGNPGIPDRMRLGPWVRTGDLARQDEDGYFWYQGRNDDLIKSAGYRIGPAEVEDCLVGHPSVAEAAVIGKPDAARGAIVKAFVRLMPDVEGTDELKHDLQQHVKAQLAAYKYPREIEFVKTFRMTSSSKINRRQLREKEIAAAAADGEIAPRPK